MDIKQLKAEMQQCLQQNILDYWLERMTDHEHGGYYGRIDGHDRLDATAPKGAVLNARILWSFAAAYRVLGKPEYLDAAIRARDYIIDHFIDHEQGGELYESDALSKTRGGVVFTLALPAICASFFD